MYCNQKIKYDDNMQICDWVPGSSGYFSLMWQGGELI